MLVYRSFSSKIRHFYDIYYLLSDEECKEYIHSANFKEDFCNLIEHDKLIFQEPEGWRQKDFPQSPLITNFDQLWDKLKITYNTELLQIAFTKLPDEKDIKIKIKTLIDRLYLKEKKRMD